MVRQPLDKVRYLSLREIAAEWSVEAELPVGLMLRELRYAVINIPRLRNGQGLIEHALPENELPDPDEQVERDWLIEFCGKQGWTFPGFWKGNLEAVPHFPGRPPYPNRIAIEKELERRGQDGLLEPTLAGEARYLREWAERQHPEVKPPSPLTIENACRAQYRKLRAAHKNK